MDSCGNHGGIVVFIIQSSQFGGGVQYMWISVRWHRASCTSSHDQMYIRCKLTLVCSQHKSCLTPIKPTRPHFSVPLHSHLLKGFYRHLYYIYTTASWCKSVRIRMPLAIENMQTDNNVYTRVTFASVHKKKAAQRTNIAWLTLKISNTTT